MNRIPGQVHYGPSPGWRTKSRTEFSSDANIELDISSNNQHWIIFSSILGTTVNDEMIAEISQDNGSSWKSDGGGYTYQYSELNNVTETHTRATAANIPMTADNVITNGSEAWSGEVRIFKPNATDPDNTWIEWSLRGTSAPYRYIGSAYYNINASAITNIRFDIGTFFVGTCLHLFAD